MQGLARYEDVFDKSLRAQGGLPNCRLCGQEFSWWAALKRHIDRKGCQGLRQEQTSVDENFVPALAQAQPVQSAQSSGGVVPAQPTQETWREGPITSNGEAVCSPGHVCWLIKEIGKMQGVNVLIPLSCVLCSEFRAFPVLYEIVFPLPMHEFSWLKNPG